MGRAAPGSLFGLAPNGVYRAPAIALGAVGSYPTFSPLPGEPGGLFSVALSVDGSFRNRRLHVSPAEPRLRSIASCGVRTFLSRHKTKAILHPSKVGLVLKISECF